MAQKTDKVKEFNALQDWMCSLGEPASSVLVSVALAFVVVVTALVLKMLF